MLFFAYSCVSNIPPCLTLILQNFLPVTNSGFICLNFFLLEGIFTAMETRLNSSVLHTAAISPLWELFYFVFHCRPEESSAVSFEDGSHTFKPCMFLRCFVFALRSVTMCVWQIFSHYYSQGLSTG